MTEQELKKLIEQKQKELDKLQVDIEKVQYQKHVDTFMNNINIQNELIRVIKDNQLNINDCRLFATKICENLSSIYDLVSEDIKTSQARRQHMNDARNQRRARDREKDDEAKADIVNKLIEAKSSHADTSSVANRDASAINITTISGTTKPDAVRQY